MVEAVADENPLKYSLGRLLLPLASMPVTSTRYAFIQHLFTYHRVPDSELRSIENKKNETQFLSIKSSKSSRVGRRATINNPSNAVKVSNCSVARYPRYQLSKRLPRKSLHREHRCGVTCSVLQRQKCKNTRSRDSVSKGLRDERWQAGHACVVVVG